VRVEAWYTEGPYRGAISYGGVIVNSGEVPALDVEVVFACYDSGGAVVDLGCVDSACDNPFSKCLECVAGLAEVAPGGRVVVEYHFRRNPSQVARVSAIMQYTPSSRDGAGGWSSGDTILNSRFLAPSSSAGEFVLATGSGLAITHRIPCPDRAP
jgi:hypothetical protein